MNIFKDQILISEHFSINFDEFCFHFRYSNLVSFELEQAYGKFFSFLKCVLFINMVDSCRLIISSGFIL